MKKFVFDSSSIISLSERCMLKLLGNIIDAKGMEIFLPASVYDESVTRPLHIKRFEFNAIRIKDMVDTGLMTVVPADPGLGRDAECILETTNRIFSSPKGNVRIIHLGEAEALAVVNKIGADALVIDERTTRELIENPPALQRLISKRRNVRITIDREALGDFRARFGGLKIARSIELAAFAYENNLFGDVLPHTKQTVEALMYALKYAGCAIAIDEIKEYLRALR